MALTPVRKSPDLVRILERKPKTPIDIELLRDRLTERLKTKGGRMRFLPLQALALYEAKRAGGLFANIPVGGGKTLTSAALPAMIGMTRPLLLVPANLREKTRDEFEALSHHWLMPVHIELRSYAEVSRNPEALEEINPSHIIMDEAHKLSNVRAGRTRRVARYIRERRAKGEKVGIFAMSGTFMSRQLADFFHILGWTFPPETRRSPLPYDRYAVTEWDEALHGSRTGEKRRLGALRLFIKDKDARKEAGVRDVRRAIRDHMAETPGVVLSMEPATKIPITITAWEPPTQPPEPLLDAFEQMRNWQLPSEDFINDGLDMWKRQRQLSAGVWYVWNPEPPQEWLDARREWVYFASSAIKYSEQRRRPIDTPGQVAAYVEAGLLEDPNDAWGTWKRTRPSFTINAEARWVRDWVITAAEQWAIDNKAIVWVDLDKVGKAFRRIPYFGAADEGIRTYRGACAASIKSHGTGKNLVQWDKALILAPQSSARAMQQLLGRHHRLGQKSQQVDFFVAQHTIDLVNALETANELALALEDDLGEPQRLHLAEQKLLTKSDVHARIRSGCPMWQTIPHKIKRVPPEGLI